MASDLNLRCADPKKTQLDFRYISLLTACAAEGYQTIALNQPHSDMNIQIKPNSVTPIPRSSLESSLQKQSIAERAEKFNQLSRITLEINDGKFLPQLRMNKNLASYDIIAIKTRNEKVFHSLCIDYDDYDILSFEMTERLPFLPKRGWISEAVRKGLSFEISYSDGIEDPTKKRTMLANCMNVVKMTKGKNIILSSCASSDFDHRSPFDLTMIGSLIGLSQDQTQDVLFKNAENCVKRSRYRKTYEGTVAHASKADLDEFKAKKEKEVARIQRKIQKKKELNEGGIKPKKSVSQDKTIQQQQKSQQIAAGLTFTFDPSSNIFLNPNRLATTQKKNVSTIVEEELTVPSQPLLSFSVQLG